MLTNTSISTSMLIGCGPKKQNFQTLVTESSNKQVQYAICKATTLKYKTWQRYKTQRMGTDFWPTLYNAIASFKRIESYSKGFGKLSNIQKKAEDFTMSG